MSEPLWLQVHKSHAADGVYWWCLGCEWPGESQTTDSRPVVRLGPVSDGGEDRP